MAAARCGCTRHALCRMQWFMACRGPYMEAGCTLAVHTSGTLQYLPVVRTH